jgi:hypothetical protein
MDEPEEGMTAEILEEVPNQASLTGEASLRWRVLPDMRVARSSRAGTCVLSDGRFAVFGGVTVYGSGNGARRATRRCEVLNLDGGIARWEELPPMPVARYGFACAAVRGCVIVAGGCDGILDVYEEALGRWRQFPCSLPNDAGFRWMGSALMQR